MWTTLVGVPSSQGKNETSEVTRSVQVAANATVTRESHILTARRLLSCRPVGVGCEFGFGESSLQRTTAIGERSDRIH